MINKNQFSKFAITCVAIKPLVVTMSRFILISIKLRLEGPLLVETHVSRLLVGQLGQLCVEVGREVQARDVLVHLAREQVDFARFVPTKKSQGNKLCDVIYRRSLMSKMTKYFSPFAIPRGA